MNKLHIYLFKHKHIESFFSKNEKNTKEIYLQAA